MNIFEKRLLSAVENGNLNALFKGMLEEGLNNLLKAELTAFLGYEAYGRSATPNYRNGFYKRKFLSEYGELELLIPRDRLGKFHSHLLPAYSRRTKKIDKTVLDLYAHGVTTTEITQVVEKLYGKHYSAMTVSNISKQMANVIFSYHQRQLHRRFFCIFLDATYINTRLDGKVVQAAVHVALGITDDGHKTIIDYAISPTESASQWKKMLTDFKKRGLDKVDLFVSDGVVGIRPIIDKLYPNADLQRCFIHVIRQVSRQVAYQDRKAISQHLSSVAKASDREQAEKILEDFYHLWKGYTEVVKGIKEIKDEILTFLKYPKKLHKSIYTTNLLESFNKVLKRKTKAKEQFPTKASLDNFVGTIILNYNKRYQGLIYNNFAESLLPLL